ncbi:hypothetical protein AAH979_38465 [Plantactinospora sp. ZYX-F-223]|uniref:hypothetical protein n=1 Tax=Plantactinospora sp. ZYX-F-223 TaxID=3144103 RepID=UPI0031FD6B28
MIGSEAWTGETADRYDQHRRKLVADLDDCAELAGKVAGALGECAQTLRHNQEMLTREREKLSNRPLRRAARHRRHALVDLGCRMSSPRQRGERARA